MAKTGVIVIASRRSTRPPEFVGHPPIYIYSIVLQQIPPPWENIKGSEREFPSKSGRIFLYSVFRHVLAMSATIYARLSTSDPKGSLPPLDTLPVRRETSSMRTYNLDAMRQSVGLTRTQWMRMLGAHQDSDLFKDGAVTWTVAHRADRIVELYDEFVGNMKDGIAASEIHAAHRIDGVPYFSTIQAARLLDLGDFHVTNLRRRGKIKGKAINPRAHGYSAQDLYDFINSANETTPSYLSTSFVRFLEQELTGPVSGLLWDVPYTGPYFKAYRQTTPISAPEADAVAV